MLDSEKLLDLLRGVAQGQVSPDLALDRLKSLDTQLVADFARLDHHRSLRTGFPEVIWGQDKTPDQIAQIMRAMQSRQTVVMATRVSAEVYGQIRSQVRDLRYFPLARICATVQDPSPLQSPLENQGQPIQNKPIQNKGTIGILTAGTADLPVAEEAAVTAELCGFQVDRLWDVGVAGIHRLLQNRVVLDRADVLIVVAGMEGALPSVVAGLVDCPVIAVPTSVGYGASFGGLAPLLTMLNSCAAGIGVVNIDNGFGAAILAGQILRTMERMTRSRT
ncbi:MAG: nickel pincer cofactor biosynthesis protein LarB [Prochlorotrichaceae cyanobacterium]|jgi:NCAIR mutase (PurE)-related protein